MTKIEEKLKRLAGVKTDKLIPAKEKKEPKKRGKNGGRRPGSGRPPGGVALERRTLRAMLAKHYGEEVEIEVEDPLTHKKVMIKKSRVLAVMEKLYKVGIENGNDAALDRWLNRALGKPPQPLVGDEEEDPVQINLGVDRILGKVYGDDEEDD